MSVARVIRLLDLLRLLFWLLGFILVVRAISKRVVKRRTDGGRVYLGYFRFILDFFHNNLVYWYNCYFDVITMLLK